MLKIDIGQENGRMEKKESIYYIVEREFLGKISAEELISRIIVAHLKNRHINNKKMQKQYNMRYNENIGTAVEQVKT